MTVSFKKCINAIIIKYADPELMCHFINITALSLFSSMSLFLRGLENKRKKQYF